MAKRGKKRMKVWHGFVIVEIRSGRPWYRTVEPTLTDANRLHAQADDGLMKSTRIARCRITELPPKRARGKKKGTR